MKKHKALWISLTAVNGVLAIALGVGLKIAEPYTDSINSFLKAKTFEIVETGDGNQDTTYFKSAYASQDSLTAHEESLCENVEAEGAVLLKNSNNTLPLSGSSKFSCFSHSSVDPVYGGTGSGGVDTAKAVTLRTALNESFGDSSVNPTLWRFYLTDCTKYKRGTAATTGGNSEQYTINEVPYSLLSSNSTITGSYSAYSDVALVVLSRSGGEGSDLPFNTCTDGIKGNYLALSQNEIDLLSALKAYKDQGTFKKIVVLVNSSNALQLDFLDNAAYGIDAALWIGDPGQTGMRAVAKILHGDINPSGRLVDTFLKNNLASPSIVNFGMHDYANPNNYDLGWEQYNASQELGAKCNQKYHVYQEGIYVGYKYFETRYEDYVMGSGNAGDYAYSDEVAFPFGYGSSYTSFAYENFSLAEKDKTFEVTVTIKNTGDKAGKHTALIFAQSPYTDYDKEHGIEKPAVFLAGFAKSGTIEAGKSEEVKVTVDKKDLASYDADGLKSYLLESGNYYFTVGANAHNAVNNILAKKGFDNAKKDEAGSSSLVKEWDVHSDDKKTYTVSSETGYAITNQFDNADLNRYEGTSDQKITYLSRNNWTGTFPKQAVALSVTSKMWEDGLINTDEGRKAIVEKMIADHYSSVTSAPSFSQQNGLQLVSYMGLAYDNELWDKLLSQASYAEITNVIYSAFHQTNGISSVGLPETLDENGPQGFTAKIVGGSSGMCYTSEDVMAATYNETIMADIGACIGEDFLNAQNTRGSSKYSGLYGPGCNIHRNPYCGRNFEYFSEDGLLSAKMVAPEVKAIQGKGVYVFAKHFFLNDQENGRMGLSTWSNEQAIREIYARGFEGVVDGGGTGVMTSFGRLGVTWAGGHYGAIHEMLRNEWGCQGAVITDCSYYCGYMDYGMGVLAGVNLWDGDTQVHVLDNYADKPAVASMVKESLHRICYSVGNSCSMNGLSSTSKFVFFTPWWKITALSLSIAFGVLALASAGMLTYTLLSKKKEQPTVA